MNSLNKITKTKIIKKYKLDNIEELSKIDFKSVFEDKNILESSIEIYYKNKDKILVIDYISSLTSTKE